MENKTKETEQLNVSEEQLKTLKDVILHRLKVLYSKEDKHKNELRVLIDLIRSEKKSIWLSSLFQFLGVANIGAMFYRLNDMAINEIVGGFIIGGASLIIGTIVNVMSRKQKKELEHDLVDFIKKNANDKTYTSGEEITQLSELTFGNVPISEDGFDQVIKDICAEEFDNYSY